MNLQVLQLGDSALPIGGYSHSWGLEAAIDEGVVTNPTNLETWLRHWLRDVVGPLEGVLVAATCRAASERNWLAILSYNDLLRANLTPLTLRQASCNMGAQLLQLAEFWPWAEGFAPALQTTEDSGQATDWHHAIVFGTLAAAAKSSPRDAIAVYFHQAALGCISAGVRGIPIGHTHGQQILARLHDEIHGLADEFAERAPETAGSFCPAYEVLCHAQANLYTRLFRS